MIDRRVFVVALMALVVAFGLRSAMAGTPDQQAETTESNEARTPAPITPAAAATNTTTSVTVDEQPTTTSTTQPAPAASVPSTIADIEILVESRRPTIEATEPPEDHHADDGEHNPTGGRTATSTEQIAATVVGAGWTWRYDDIITRQVDALGPVAYSAVTEMLAPSAEELQRRVDMDEVSWVIIRDITVDGSQATVSFDQHLVTSTTAETVVGRSVVVTTAAGVAVEVSL